ncbi:putative type IX secretion system sortase PorU2 [Pedobacter ureilyticus]|uniref:C25 family cysteine peptidase n=1 Tax=Pedobacter ureilyticus TaxID=1393051 RepID=A0ABW9J286_9SPHI|nr:C25 family cysteine peptidase [Pedobacter helvus]
MQRFYLSILLTFCCLRVFSQTPYGNDWINVNQSYYKIKVSQKGIYRLNYTTLSEQISNLNSINPKYFQLFKNGKEIAMYINGESDGIFNTNDYIEFYGEPNDGTLDKELYISPTAQPHNHYSLFTDTAAYFLTIGSNIQGKRIQNFSASKIGLIPEAYIIQESIGIYPETFYQGRFIIAHMSLTDYQEGEGFMGSTYGLGEQQIRTLSTPNLYTGSGSPVIKFESYVAGRSDAQSTNPQGNNHHLRISIKNGTSVAVKKDTLFKAYAVARTAFGISQNELGQNTQIIYEAVNDLGAQTDFQAVSYAKIIYPRTTDLQGTGNLSFSLNSSAQNRFLNFTNNNKILPIIWDNNTDQRITGEINGTNAEFVLPASSSGRNFFLYDGNSLTSPTLTKVEMQNFSINTFDKNFIIVTNKKLLTSAQNYAAYRNKDTYKSYLITTEQLYDQFYYGIHHPLAIKNFVKYLLQFAAKKPEYLLLLGKGLENNLIRSAGGINEDLVPTYGSPPSDDLLTARINNNSLAPAIPTGRVGAKTNEEVEIYLEKLKRYELYENAIWRKKLIHVSGGTTLSENLSWAAYQANMYNMAKDEPFGADTVNFHKNVSLPISAARKQQIISEINNGASLLSFLGHGSHQHTEIDFGTPEELANNNRLLTYLVNGCTTGNVFINSSSLGEKHIFYPQKGAIGWIGTSSEGVASYLSNFSSIFYQKAFTSNYGISVASALKLAKEQYQNQNDLINVMHTSQYTFQGDPAIKFYAPEKPDFEITSRDLFISPNDVTAVSTSFSIGIIVKNIAKAVNKPLKVSLKRALPNGSIISYPSQSFSKPVYNTDTLFFNVSTNDILSAGINKFTVTLDPDGEYDEISKSNNIASFDYNMLSNGINLLYPKKNSIVSNQEVELTVQSSDLNIRTANYIFEIDTLSSFDSPWKKNSSLISAGFMANWKPTVLNRDNQVYYWRAKLDLPTDKGGTWQESNFSVINGSQTGWNQSHIDQLKHGLLTNIEYNNTSRQLEFAKSGFYTVIQTRGDDAPTSDERTFRSNPGGRLGYHSWEFEGLSIFALKPNTFDPFSYTSVFNVVNQEADGSAPYNSGHYIFNTNNPVHLDSLVNYIKQIPSGYYVIGFNGRNADFSALPQLVKNEFLTIGVSNIGNIPKGEPYMFWGIKEGMQTAIEKMADYTSPLPARSQQIRFDHTYPFPFDHGTYITEQAGPAKKWHNLSYEFRKESSDEISFDLIGYNKGGQMLVLQTNLPSTVIDLSNYSAVDYPRMALRANIKDLTNRTVPQILYCKFNYDDISETTINPELKYEFHKSPIQEGDSVKWDIGYQNISKYPSDSTHVYYTLTKPDRSIVKIKAGKIEELAPGAQTIFKLKLPTIGIVGNNLLKLDFTPVNNLDSYGFNNYIQQSFTVTSDNKEPIVDVAFDGKHIMNGEIVSPQPNILVNLTDENSFILLKDTTVMNVYLKSENGSFKRIAYSAGLLNFIPANSTNHNKASVMYKPTKLTDGIYTLMVEAKDATGNINTSNNYTIDFEVINESAITHFYPYPNPFTTAMKFVYTLTGDKIPDKIKVQIMTVTGKIVREIFKEELGNIRIGNNISDFTWDGTDMYGDRLANGVYFYKVIVENNDRSEIKHRKTATDSFFKQNTGKIYLMK